MSEEDFAGASYASGPGEESETDSAPYPESLESARCLSFDEAARCLDTLGSTESGLRYAYLRLDASEKRLTDIGVIPTFRNVLYVDVSGNRLTQSALSVLVSMTYLLGLKADRNRLTSARLEPAMLYLQTLSLSRNRISDTSGIAHRLLESLELNYNRITSVELNPYILENMKSLEMRGNLLTTTNGIFLPGLVYLYLADNRIEKLEGLEALASLETLHARGNNISSLDVRACERLRYVNLRSNRIASFREVAKLRSLAGLRILVMSGNPVAASVDEEEDEDGYRAELIAAIPQLTRIDKDPVRDEERERARELRGGTGSTTEN